jgi:hypothetical protein
MDAVNNVNFGPLIVYLIAGVHRYPEEVTRGTFLGIGAHSGPYYPFQPVSPAARNDGKKYCQWVALC